MKECLNCFTLNEAHIEKCSYCRMRGRFRPVTPPERSPSASKAPNSVACPNCGLSAEGQAYCPHCRFPIRAGLQVTALRSYAPIES